jgi:NADH dehydrogenase subunit J (EC 1.6.5.3)
MELLAFVVISIIAIVSALGAILVKSPIHVMVWFLGFILSVAASFFALKADLLAGLQLVIYAVAIVVFYVLVITTIPWEKVKMFEGFYKKEFVFALPAFLFTIGASIYLVISSRFSNLRQPLPKDNVSALGTVLFTKYIAPFELASFILLIAMIGAIIFGKEKANG